VSYLTIGGIIATGWQTTFEALESGLKSGVITATNLHDEAARLFGQNYQWIADRVADWSGKVSTANGPLATAYAANIRADYLAQGQALTNNAVSALERLNSASAFMNQELGKVAVQMPAIASRIGTAFDFLQVADAAYRGDMSGVYGNLAQMLATAATALIVTAAITAVFPLAPVMAIAVVAGGAAAAVGLIGSDLMSDFYGDFGRWAEPYARGFGQAVGNFGGWLGRSSYDRLPPSINTAFLAAINFVYPCDPLVLDLDGDGIDAIEINPSSLVLFDHNADGIKQATGWIKSDDGILVLDRNGNGTIDSGRELFGDNTLNDSTSDPNDKYANGYEAIAALDLNGDHKIDSSDAAYSQLRVWQDANQNGISEASELKTLADLGIASIGVVGTASNVNLGNGNTMPLAATFTRNNGTTGTSGTPDVSGSLLLASNNFYREFTDDPVVTLDAAALPQIGGSGLVRDLREAMSIGNADASGLEASVSAFAAASTRQAQLSLIDGLLSDWAKTSGRLVSSTYRYNVTLMPEGYLSTSDFFSSDVGQTVLTLNPAGLLEDYIEPATGMLTKRPNAQGQEVLQRLNVLEVFNGSKFFQIPVPPPPPPPGLGLGGGGGGGSSGIASAVQATAALSGAQVDLLNQSYEALRTSVYEALVMQTRLKPYVEAIELVIDENGLGFDFTGMQALLNAKRASSPLDALADLAELHQLRGNMLASMGGMNIGLVKTWLTESLADPAIATQALALQAELGINISNAAYVGGSDKRNIVFGGAADQSIHGGASGDILLGGAGADTIWGGGGDDILDGGSGNDVLIGGQVNVFNDIPEGTGNDTYLFGRGDGHDDVFDVDGTTGNVDRVIFKAGVSSSDVKLTRNYGDLVLSIIGTTDTLTLHGYLGTEGHNASTIELIQFTDGTTWDLPAVQALLLLPTEGDDATLGYASDDIINGAGGNDALYGLGGNDSLFGGTGNDQLEGGAGNDVLDGGAGNDTLIGSHFDGWTNVYVGAGNDTYRFGRGDGNDVIFDNDDTVGNFDKIVFKSGIAAADIRMKRLGDDSLELTIADTGETLTVRKHFAAGGAWQIEQIAFADDAFTVWSFADLAARSRLGGAEADALFGGADADVMSGGGGDDALIGRAGDDALSGDAGNDTLEGDDGNDLLAGGSGNDSLYGGNGDDTLDGGAGNDFLASGGYSNYYNNYVGGGNDTYLFGIGDGQDTIYDNEGSGDKILFKAGVLPADVSVRRGAANAIVLGIVGTTDTITIAGQLANAGLGIEEVRFADDSSPMSSALAMARTRSTTTPVLRTVSASRRASCFQICGSAKGLALTLSSKSQAQRTRSPSRSRGTQVATGRLKISSLPTPM
jgi:Ca2+-binding RTX toxin-like protein